MSDLLERLHLASHDERCATGELYREAALKLAEYIEHDARYWVKIMRRSDKQADHIEALERLLREADCYRCDGGVIYEDRGDGQQDEMPCQWCAAKDKLIGGG